MKHGIEIFLLTLFNSPIKKLQEKKGINMQNRLRIRRYNEDV